MSEIHKEKHRVERVGWLRAVVLGANDGIVSTASLAMGVAAANATTKDILLAAVAGTVAGAMSMAAGEYVSVSSQADTEQSDLALERRELAANGTFEHEELTAIYVKRGLDESLARQVATQLMAKDALGAHARDELGISEMTTARPIQAALASAVTFVAGALLPVLTVAITPRLALAPVLIVATIFFLAILGGFGAFAGGAPLLKGAARVTMWGMLAMALTALVGALFGTTISPKRAGGRCSIAASEGQKVCRWRESIQMRCVVESFDLPA